MRPQLAAGGACLRGRQPYSQEVGPVPKCKRRMPAGLVVAVVASGVLAATALAATIDGDDGPNRLIGTSDADVIRALGGNDRVLASRRRPGARRRRQRRRARRRRQRRGQRRARVRPAVRRGRQRRAAGLAGPGPPVGRAAATTRSSATCREAGDPISPRPSVGRPGRRHAARRRRARRASAAAPDNDTSPARAATT